MNTGTPMAKLAVAITLGFFGVLILMMFAEVKLELKDPLLLMLGALIGNFNSVISYYFGTTSGSQRKDETITKLTETAAAVASTAQAAAAQPTVLQTDAVAIDAQTVNVDSQPPKGNP